MFESNFIAGLGKVFCNMLLQFEYGVLRPIHYADKKSAFACRPSWLFDFWRPEIEQHAAAEARAFYPWPS